MCSVSFELVKPRKFIVLGAHDSLEKLQETERTYLSADSAFSCSTDGCGVLRGVLRGVLSLISFGF